jgi:hypothetical protein
MRRKGDVVCTCVRYRKSSCVSYCGFKTFQYTDIQIFLLQWNVEDPVFPSKK